MEFVLKEYILNGMSTGSEINRNPDENKKKTETLSITEEEIANEAHSNRK